MTQVVYTGTAGDDFLDGSSLGTKDIAVFRGLGGNDTMIGGNGNDRFDGGAGGDSMSGGLGDDMFFISLDNRPGVGAHDTIDGGLGGDLLVIAAGAYQMTNAVIAEFTRLNIFLTENAGNSAAVFTSEILHLTMSAVEFAKIRLDGVLGDISSYAAGPITFQDLNSGDLLDYNYHGFDWLAGGVPAMIAFDTAVSGYTGSGYDKGAGTPGHVVAINQYEYEPIQIMRDDGGTFTFLQVLASSAWNSSQTLVFEGYLKGVLVGQQTVTVTDTGPTKIQANWGLIDDLEIRTIGTPTADPVAAAAGNIGNNLVFDNFFLI
jgi:hypothetical protein